MLKISLNLDNFDISEIESIELIGESDTVDITVEDVHMFYANDVYTHNSALNKESFGMDAIGESLGKAATADLVVGVARPDGAKANNEATIGILKNRNGADGFYFPAIFDTTKVFIELVDVQQGFVPKNKDNTNNSSKGDWKQQTKRQEMKKEDENNIQDILLGE